MFAKVYEHVPGGMSRASASARTTARDPDPDPDTDKHHPAGHLGHLSWSAPTAVKELQKDQKSAPGWARLSGRRFVAVTLVRFIAPSGSARDWARRVRARTEPPAQAGTMRCSAVPPSGTRLPSHHVCPSLCGSGITTQSLSSENSVWCCLRDSLVCFILRSFVHRGPGAKIYAGCPPESFLLF